VIALLLNLLFLGSAIALPAAAALALTRGAAPRLRYCGALLAFGAAAVFPVAVTIRVERSQRLLPYAQAGVDDVAMLLDEGIVRRLAAVGWLAVAAILVAREAAAHRDLMRRESAEQGPAAVGLLRPRIVLPPWLARLTPAAAARIVRHERAHARWRDPLVNAIVRLTRAVLWPSLPLWYLERLIRTEQEVAADAAALAGEAEEASAEYASSLIEAVRYARHDRHVAAFGSAAALRERIERLLGVSRPGIVRIAAAAAMIAAGALVVAEGPAASGVYAMPAHAVGDPTLDALIAGTRYHDHLATKGVQAQLARLRHAESLAPLAAAMRHPDRRVRESAAWLAGELSDSRAVPLLVERLDDPDPHTRNTASLALGGRR
jgi:hypothetical protein